MRQEREGKSSVAVVVVAIASLCAICAPGPRGEAEGQAAAVVVRDAPVGLRKVRMTDWRRPGFELEHLNLEEGRRLYLGPREIGYHWPYLVAAHAAERRLGYGWAVEFDRAHELFEPIRTADQVLEAVRLFGGAVTVPDEAAWRELVALAEQFDPMGAWEAKVAKGTPPLFGLRVEQLPTGFAVHALQFTSPGYGSLDVVERHYGFPYHGAFQRKQKIWIDGPPQAWQTTYEEGEDAAIEEETKLRKNIHRLRVAMMACLSRYRTIEHVRAALRKSARFAQVRFDLGEPDEQLGSGRLIYRYSLGDGTSVLLGLRRAMRIADATHVDAKLKKIARLPIGESPTIK